AGIGVGHIDVMDALFFDRLRDEIVAKPGALRHGLLRILHHPPRLSSVRTSLATALRVSNTPSPVDATAGTSTTRAGFRSWRSSSSGAALARSRLLYWITYGSFSRA